LHVLNNVIQNFVPLTHICEKRRRYPKHVIKLQSHKKRVWRLYRKNTSLENKNRYLSVSKQTKDAIHQHYLSQERSILTSKNNGLFYRFVNKRLKNVKDLCVSHEEESALATEFNTYFSSVFTNDNNFTPVFTKRSDNKMSDIVAFDNTSIITAINKLNPKFSSGPDGLCPYFLKQIRYSIVLPLSKIFEISYQTGKLPKIWSQAIVIPIFKKGDPSSVKNYRPISLCSVPCKIMESIINDKITVFLKTHNLIHKNQHGFMKNKSCSTQLVKCKNIWSKFLDSHIPTDIIYIDFSKAFDSVVHSKLLEKLKAYSFGNKLLNWINSFLKNRSQIVKVGHSFSNPLPVTSGVPQGSVLGPTLFSIYVNDLCDIGSTSHIMLFADDVKIFNTSLNHDTLQTDLEKVCRWSEDWQLSIAKDKCNAFYLGTKNPKHKYQLCGNDISETSVVRDLGVHFTNNLSSAAQCQAITNKASRICNLIHKAFFSRNTNLLVKAFVTYVRPILEYASVVWNPYQLCDINEVEKVQRKFSKRILPNEPYSQRLKILGLERLEMRRIHADLCFAFNLLKTDPAEFEYYFQFSDILATRSRNSKKLFLKHVKLDCMKHDFSIRTVPLWNHLEESVVTSNTVKTFRYKLKDYDFQNFLKGRV
jgi:hypothetical protein